MKYEDYIKRKITKLEILCKENYGLLFILFCSIIISIIYYTGIYSSDDISTYVPNMFSISDGLSFKTPLRLPITILALISYKIANDIRFVPLVFSAVYPLIIVLSFIIINLLANKKAAYISAALILASSVVYSYSGAILPDNLAVFFTLLSYILLIYSFRKTSKKIKTLYLMITGLLCFITYLIKEPYVILFIGFFPLTYSFENNWKSVFKKAIIVATSFIIFYILYKLITVQFGIPFSIGEKNRVGDSYMLNHYIQWNKAQGINGFIDHVIYTFKILAYSNVIYIQIIFVIFSVFYGIKYKKYYHLVFTLPSVFLFLAFACGTISFTGFVGVPVQTRYLVGVHVFLILQSGLILSETKFLSKNYYYYLILLIIGIYLSISILFNLPYAGNIYYSVGQRAFDKSIEALQLIRKDYPIYYDGNEDSMYRYPRTYSYYSDKIELIDYNNNSGPFYYYSLFVSQNENGNLFNEARRYADENGYIFVMQKVKEGYSKEFLKNTPFNSKRYFNMYYGFFVEKEERDYSSIKINNNSFELWSKDLPTGYKRRTVFINDIVESTNSYIGDKAVEIFSTKDEINYIYFEVPLQEDKEYVDAIVEVKYISNKADAQIKASSLHDFDYKNKNVYVKGNSKKWETLSANIRIGKNCKSLKIVLYSIGEGSVIYDNLQIKLR